MEKLAAERQIKTKFVGFQKNVPQWLTAADIVLVPSHVEPLGNATLEAMALGRPVIGTNIGGIPEMIDNEKTGLLVQPKKPDELAKALERLIRSSPERATFGDQARQKCEAQFSLETHIKNTLKIYHSTLKLKPKHH